MASFQHIKNQETQINQAKNAVKSLVRYEYEADGVTPRQVDGKIVVRGFNDVSHLDVVEALTSLPT